MAQPFLPALSEAEGAVLFDLTNCARQEIVANTSRSTFSCNFFYHPIHSAKACDALLAVRVPPAAMKLRRILNLAQILQSHALSFFYLSSPDLLLGMDADSKGRNIFGVMRSNPELGRCGIRLRQFGQQVIETLAGRRIHPRWVVSGDVNEPLSAD